MAKFDTEKAIIELQERVKSLEEENKNLKKSIDYLDYLENFNFDEMEMSSDTAYSKTYDLETEVDNLWGRVRKLEWQND